MANVLLHEEVQLMDWGESRSAGPFIKFRLDDPALLEVFRGMDTATAKRTGHILHLTVAEGDIVAAPEPAPVSGEGVYYDHRD